MPAPVWIRSITPDGVIVSGDYFAYWAKDSLAAMMMTVEVMVVVMMVA